MELEYSFISAEDANIVRVIATFEEETPRGVVSNFALIKYNRVTNQWGRFNLPWEVCSLATRRIPNPEVFVLNPEGFVGRGYGDFREEDLSLAGENGPDVLGPLREVRAVGDGVFCAGMGRQVYASSVQGPWRALHMPSMITKQSLMEVTGFNSIHGLSTERLWAVGMGGEIWRYAHGVWEKEESPTNLALHKVLVFGENRALAVGQAGLVLTLDRGQWRETLTLEGAGDIWDACEFMEEIYVSTESSIYRLDRALKTATAIPISNLETFGYLDSAEGVIWSSGFSDIGYSIDGKQWHVITP